MLTPTYVNLNYFFYPIGNTPAVNFLRDQPSCEARSKELQAVKLLSIACGDPRNLLFSLWCEDGKGECSLPLPLPVMKLTRELVDAKCTIDFMCCDIEPAVLGA
jgi:hypothetical protein